MKRFLGLSVMLLAFVFVFTGCPDSGGGSSDNWSNVESIEHLNGTWAGSFSENMSIRDFMEDEFGGWDSEMQAYFGNMSVRLTMNMTLTINSNTSLMTGTQGASFRFSGGNINNVWPELREMFEWSGFDVNDSNRTVSMIEPFTESITIADFPGVQVNQNYTKFRIPMSEIDETSSGYMVFDKQ